MNTNTKHTTTTNNNNNNNNHNKNNSSTVPLGSVVTAGPAADDVLGKASQILEGLLFVFTSLVLVSLSLFISFVLLGSFFLRGSRGRGSELRST